MKNCILILLLTLFTFTVSAQQNKKSQKAVIKTALYCDHCKDFETCGKNFSANLYKINGLKMYELDEKAMTITVYYNAEKTSLLAIKTALSKLGYDADEIKADVDAYDKLDGCCKKA